MWIHFIPWPSPIQKPIDDERMPLKICSACHRTFSMSFRSSLLRLEVAAPVAEEQTPPLANEDKGTGRVPKTIPDKHPPRKHTRRIRTTRTGPRIRRVVLVGQKNLSDEVS